MERFRDCAESRCRATVDRAEFNVSDAVIFHTQPADFQAQDLPGHRWPHQRFVMYFYEPHMYSSRATMSLAPAHFFNWTLTWRRTSDIPGTEYGAYQLIDDSLQRRHVKDHNAFGEESLDDFYGVNITARTRLVAWFNSHCPTPIGREDLAAELARYVPIDIYGRCGNLTCVKRKNHESDECDAMLADHYLFYLSFENSFCDDYVTEKLFRPLRLGVVPVVLGGAHYSQFAPPGSYIDVLDFASVQQLAAHLSELAANRRHYARHLQWRRHFRVPDRSDESWCRLCSMLHDDTLPAKSYENVAAWWFDEQPCPKFKWTNATSQP